MLAALLLVQAVSFTPRIDNIRGLPAEVVTYEIDARLGGPAAPLFELGPATGLPSLLTAEPAAFNLAGDTAIRQSVDLSNGYYTRLDIHRYASYATLPLFAVEVMAGQKLLEEGSGAPLWAEKVHKPAAYLVAGVFAVNAVTGLLNYSEARSVKQGKKRRTVHTILMLASTAGFIYSGTQAPTTAEVDERIANGTRGGWTRHKASAWASMSVATVGYLMMYVWKGE
ncbi:MAG TPA: hypothetical protein VG817_11235 [Gemmatimonadales bacterium]|nr:hypothetical protein [Gemmatimonadales bacterium]